MMGRTVTLKGEAAGAFVRALQNKPAVTEDDKHERIVAYVLANGKLGTKEGMRIAKLCIKSVVERGLDSTLKTIGGGDSERPLEFEASKKGRTK